MGARNAGMGALSPRDRGCIVCALAHQSASPPTVPARKRNPRHTRDRLARAALELFTTRGYHETTTPLIAARAGVAEGTIYRHFASKDELLNEVYRAGVRLFSAALKDSDARMGCRARLEGVARCWREIAAREPALVRLVFSDGVAGRVDERSRAARRDLHAELEKIVAAGKAAGAVRHGAAELLAELWLRLIELVLDRTARGIWKPDDAVVTQVIEAAWDAIGTPPARMPTPPPASTPEDTT